MKKRVVQSWSGGKDSAMAHYIASSKMHLYVECLLTTYNESNNRVSMHGVRLELIERQAEMLGARLMKIPLPPNCSNEKYEERMMRALMSLKEEGVGEVVFGDIFLEDVRRYREENLARAGFKGVFPLWGRDTWELAREFLKLGFKALICCVDTQQAPAELIGREYSLELLEKLPDSVDPCGERGEFHTFVYDGPLFPEPIQFIRGEFVLRDKRFLFMDLVPC
ncbi:MAG: diphthine--ammonia ligase [Nitrososphaerota archaeon]